MSLPKVRNSYALVLVLAVLFGLQFVWFERVVPSRAAASCSWANTGSNQQSNVLFVADPQLIDNHTYPGRNGALLRLLQHTVDKYIAQNYRAMVGHLQPDYIFFLGDYLDNGRLASDPYFARESRRFWGIFNRWPKKYQQGVNWFTNLPGNHDIGFGNGVKPHSRERFEQTFGKSNTVVEAGGVDFVIVDTPLYSAEGELNQEARAFVDSIAVDSSENQEGQQAPGNEDAGNTSPEENKDTETQSSESRRRRLDDQVAENSEIDPIAAIAAAEGAAGRPESANEASISENDGTSPQKAAPGTTPSGKVVDDLKELELKSYLNAPNKGKGKDGKDSKEPESKSASKGTSVSKFAPGAAVDSSVVHYNLPGDGRKPRVLLTHVPLYRDTSELTCGPLRESKVFLQNAGYQYQLALSPEISSEILEKIRPVVAFSGDDHDYCDVTHPSTNTREITVKSISMAMGIWRPAVQLFSFGSPKDSATFSYETHLCYLPKPYHNIVVYVMTATLIGALLLLHSLRLRPLRYNYTILPTHGQDYEQSAILAENPMSKKLSNFLKEQDEGSLLTSTPLPAYTSTSPRLRLDSALAKYRYARLAMRRFMRKYNLAFFFRLCLLEFVSVMVAYFMVVAAI